MPFTTDEEAAASKRMVFLRLFTYFPRKKVYLLVSLTWNIPANFQPIQSEDARNQLRGGGGGVALARILFFGRSKRPKKIGTAKFFWVRFSVAHEATQQG